MLPGDVLPAECREEDREQDAVGEQKQRMKPGYERDERQGCHETGETYGEIRQEIECLATKSEGHQGVCVA